MADNSTFLDKNAILSSLTEQNIIDVVCKLGSMSPKRDNKGNLIFQTICHNKPASTNSWKLYYYFPDEEHKYGSFHCYSGCSDSFNIIELCIRAFRTQGKVLTWYQALHFVANTTGKLGYVKQSAEENREIINNDYSWMEKLIAIKNKKKVIPNLKPINENVLETFCYVPHEDWLEDNISREAMSRYEISYYGLNNSIIIPHRDKNDNLIGIRQRFLDPEDIEALGKYMPLQINGHFLAHSLGSNLYGINVVQDKIKACKKCLLVESEKSCMQTYTYFGEDAFAMAVCGSNISTTQIRLLLQYLGVEEIIVGFDKEYDDPHSYEAEIYYNNLITKVAPFARLARVNLLLDTQGLLQRKDSPTDRGKDTLLKLLDQKILVTTDEVNRVMQERQNKIEIKSD